MKQYINNKSIQIIVAATIALFVIVNLVCSANSVVKYNQQMQQLYDLELFGRITGIKDQHRGSYYLEITTGSEKRQFNSLPIAWAVKKYPIEIGDSISKLSHCNSISFYKTVNGIVKLCELQLN